MAHWLAVLNADSRAIFAAAAYAQQAAHFLHGKTPPKQDSEVAAA